MKILRLLAILLLSIFAWATSIDFTCYNIFYGIGADTFSGYWCISENYNTFSEQNLGDFTPYTQLWILHHPVSVYIEPGDTIIDFKYLYRYYPVNTEVPD